MITIASKVKWEKTPQNKTMTLVTCIICARESEEADEVSFGYDTIHQSYHLHQAKAGTMLIGSKLGPVCQFRVKTTVLFGSRIRLADPGPYSFMDSLARMVFGLLVRWLASHSSCLAGV